MSPLLALASSLALGTVVAALLGGLQLRRKWLTRWNEIHRQVMALEGNVANLSAQIKTNLPLKHPAPPPKGFNLNGRAEAVRRMRAGSRPHQIELATGWSVAELELLQKVEMLHQ